MPLNTKNIVLIHGLWMTPHSWRRFIGHYETLGYRVLAPAWPRMAGDVEQLRKDPSALAGLGVREIADHYDRIVRSLPEVPILMGHSFGGLIVQMLLDRGLGAAGVAIDATAPKGVFRLPLSQLRAANPVLSNPLNYGRTVMLTFNQFRYAFANTMSERDAREAYELDAIPGPGRPLFQAAFANFTSDAATAVNFQNSRRAPLLLINGSEDNTVPASVNRSVFRKYGSANAITEYKEFIRRSHLIVGQTGWEEVADYALSWAVANSFQLGPRMVEAA